MNQQITYNRLNEYIQAVIQTSGMMFVVSNYIVLREQYYLNKPC